MQLLPLGTNGFFPSFNRETACYLVSYNQILIILDSGSGLFRLVEPEPQRLLREAQEVHMFLSHYHLDHTSGFYGAFRLLSDKKVTVFAPAKRHVFSDIGYDYFPIPYENFYGHFSWQMLVAGKNSIDSYSVSVRKQDHRGTGSLGFVFSFGLAYITDSESTKEGVAFVRGVNLLLHEHYRSGLPQTHFAEGHVTTVGAAEIAKEAGVGRLALIHHYPFADETELRKQLKIAQNIFPSTVLAHDVKVIKF